MLNLVREGEEDYIEAIRYRRRLKIFENFLLTRGSMYPILIRMRKCGLLYYKEVSDSSVYYIYLT